MTYASASTVSRNSYRANKNNIKYSSHNTGLGAKANVIILTIMACILASVYLSQVTQTNTFSYRLDELNGQKAALQSNLESLELEQAELKSLDTIRESTAVSRLSQPQIVNVIN